MRAGIRHEQPAHRSGSTGLGALVVAVGTLVLEPGCQDKAKVELDSVQTAWSSFATCLVGKPLAQGEKASMRLAAIDLHDRVSAVPPDRTAKKPSEEDWPQRCTIWLERLKTRIEATRAQEARDKLAEVLRTTEVLLLSRNVDGTPHYQLPGAGLTGVELPSADMLFEQAAGAGLVHSVVASVASPPEPVSLPPKAPVLVETAAHGLRQARIPDARFVLWDDEHTHACSVVGPDAVQCQLLGGKWASTAAPVMAAPGAGLQLFTSCLATPSDGKTRETEYGLCTGTHERLFPTTALDKDSYVFIDGSLVGIADGHTRPDEDVIVRASPGGQGLERVPFPGLKRGSRLGLVGNMAIAYEPSMGPTSKALLQEVSAEGRPSGVSQLGEVSGRSGSFGCSAEQVDVIGIREELSENPNGMRTLQLAATFRQEDGGFGPLVRQRFEARSWMLTDFLHDTGRASYSCARNELSYTLLDKDVVQALQCTPKGCRVETSGRIPAAGVVEDAVVLRLGGRILLARLVSGPAHFFMGARTIGYRLAPVEELAATPERLLAVDKWHGGFDASLRGLEGFTHSDRAYVFFAAGAELRGFTVNLDGRVSPIRGGT